MPRIPIKNASLIPNSGIPTTGMTSTSTVTPVPEAIGRLGDAVGDLGKVIQKHKAQDEAIALINTQKDIDDSFATFRESQSKLSGEDAYGSQDKVRSISDDIAKYHSDKYKDNPLLQAKIKDYVHGRAEVSANWAATHEVQQRGIVAEATWKRSLAAATEGVYRGENMTDAITEHIQDIDLMESTGAITKEAAEELRTKGIEVIAIADAERLIDTNPGGFLEVQKRGEYNGLMSQDKQHAFAEKAKSVKNAMDADAKQAEKDRQAQLIETGNQMVEDIQATWNKAWVAKGIGDKEGQLSRTLVAKSAPSDFASWPSQVKKNYNDAVTSTLARIDAAEARAEARAKAGKKTADSKSYNDFYKRAVTEPNDDNIPADAKLSNADIEEAVKDGILKPAWGQKLRKVLAESSAMADPAFKVNIKVALKELDKAEKDGLFGEDGAEKSEAIEAMYSWIKENPGKSPGEFTKELLKPKAAGWIRSLFGSDTEKPTAEDVEERLGGKPPEAGDKTFGSAPTWEAFKSLNPKYTEAELRPVYEQKYGKRK